MGTPHPHICLSSSLASSLELLSPLSTQCLSTTWTGRSMCPVHFSSQHLQNAGEVTALPPAAGVQHPVSAVAHAELSSAHAANGGGSPESQSMPQAASCSLTDELRRRTHSESDWRAGGNVGAGIPSHQAGGSPLLFSRPHSFNGGVRAHHCGDSGAGEPPATRKRVHGSPAARVARTVWHAWCQPCLRGGRCPTIRNNKGQRAADSVADQ